MKAVDRELRQRCGLTHLDLPDRLWRDAYDDGDSPEAAALDCLQSEAEELGLDPNIFD